MEVRSGAGTFHVEIGGVRVENRRILLLGTVDDWDSRTIVEPAEALHILRLVLRPKVLSLLVGAAFGPVRTRRGSERG